MLLLSESDSGVSDCGGVSVIINFLSCWDFSDLAYAGTRSN